MMLISPCHKKLKSMKLLFLITVLVFCGMLITSCAEAGPVECAGYAGTELEDEALTSAVLSGKISDASDIFYNFPEKKPQSDLENIGMRGYTWGWLSGACAIQLEAADLEDSFVHYTDPDKTEEIREILEDDWGITDRATLIAKVRRLLDGGDRQGYARFVARAKQQNIIALGDKSLDDYRKAVSEKNPSLGKSDVMKMAYAAYRYANDGLESIEFWDYSRAIEILGLGCVCEYISVEEYVFQSVPIGAMIQRNYGSWEEAGKVFLEGYEYANQLDIGSKDIDYIMRKAAYDMLCKDPNGSYNDDNDFKTDLNDFEIEYY